MSGKGDNYRPVDQGRFARAFDRIFGGRRRKRTDRAVAVHCAEALAALEHTLGLEQTDDVTDSIASAQAHLEEAIQMVEEEE